MFVAKFVNGHFSWASDPFQNHSIAKRHFYWGLKNAGKLKLGCKIFCHKTFFLSGLNRKFHIDLNGDIAVRKQNLKKTLFDGFFINIASNNCG